MSDLSANSPTTPEAAPPVERSLWLSTKKAVGRLQDWFAVQSIAVKAMVAVTAVLIAVTLLGEHLTVGGMVGSLLIVAAITSLGRASGRPTPQ